MHVEQNKPTLVVGASTNTFRHSNLVIHRLLDEAHEVYALGRSEGEVAGIPIATDQEAIELPQIDTVTLYVNPGLQASLYSWIIRLAPRRVIFNPGTANPDFARQLRENNIEPVFACTLVMLGTGTY